MKKIFLTSGLVLCMACPAMADTTNITYGGNPAAYGDSACTEPYLGQTEGSVAFEPIWENNKYSITYATDSNGTASSPVTVSNVEYDVSTHTVLAEGASTDGESGITSNPGYHFVQWVGSSTNATNYTPANYQPGASFNPYQINGDLVLTAQHDANDTTITYSCTAPANASSVLNAAAVVAGNTGNGSVPSSDTFTFGTQEQFATASCTLEGYTLSNWTCTGASGTMGLAASYTPGETVNPWSYTGAHNGTVSCAANWTANEYTITYNCGAAKDGSASAATMSGNATVSINMDANYTLAAADKCSMPGYTFKGWSCDHVPTPTSADYTVNYTDYSNQAATAWAAGATGKYTYAGNSTCTAMWQQNNIGLTWYDDTGANAQVVSGSSTACTYDNGITVPAAQEKTGYTFKGWKVRTQQ